MPLPPHPFGSTITLNSLYEQFTSQRSQEDVLRQLIQLAQHLPVLDNTLKTAAHEVPATEGCTNTIWFCFEKQTHHFHFLADSETRIVRGLLAVLLVQIEGKTHEELQNADLLTLYDTLHIMPYLSRARRQRLHDLVKLIQSLH